MNRILLISSLLLMFLTTQAQEVKFGVFVAPEASWLYPDAKDISHNATIAGIKGGIIIDKYFQKNYALQTGIAIGTQGGELAFSREDSLEVTAYNEDIMLNPNSTLRYNLNYITIPLNLKLKTNQIGYFSYFARVGFTSQMNMKAKATQTSGSQPAVFDDDSSIPEEIAFFNLTYNFGAGVEYGLSEDTSLLLGINYTNGFTDIATDNDIPAFSRGLSLRVGIIF